jgi:hypothetical protein
MKTELIKKLSAILIDSIEKPKMNFIAQHKCLIENLLSSTTVQYDFFKGGNSIEGELFHKGYIVLDCKPQVDAAIKSLIEHKELLDAVSKEISAHDASVSQAYKVLNSSELNQLMVASKKQQAEARLGFHDEYKLDCYTKASEFTDQDLSLAMHRCDAIYQDISTKHDNDISALRQAAGFESHLEL